MAIEIESNSTDDTKSESQKRTEELLRVAQERFSLASEVENDFRVAALEDKKFLAGEQWPEDVKRDRESDRRPCLTINRLKQSVKQVTNDQRQNRPSIKVHPVDDQADIETAKILQGIIKHIEYNSNADVAYDTGFEGAVHGGRGAFRIITDYVDPLSFEQEILIKRIRNDLSVYIDPNSQEPDGSDMEWCFVVEDISKESFKNQFPNAELSKSSEWESIGNRLPEWLSDTVRIAEYFYKEYEDADIVLLNNKSVLLKSDLPEVLPPGISVVATRKTKIPKIKWCKINAVEILAGR